MFPRSDFHIRTPYGDHERMKTSVSVCRNETQDVLLMELLNHPRKQSREISAGPGVNVATAGVFRDFSKG